MHDHFVPTYDACPMHSVFKKSTHKTSKVQNNAQILEYTGTEMAGEADPGTLCSVLMAAARISSWKLLIIKL